MTGTQKNNLFLTSDLHIFHKNILKYCPNRKFETIEEMEKVIIKNWNEVVTDNDYVVVVGDVFLGGTKKQKKDFLNSLNGHKILVCGNHDQSDSQMIRLGFDWACYKMQLNVNGKTVLISHYPYKPNWFKLLLLWLKGISIKHIKRMPKKTSTILLHGHTHSTKKVYKNMINVGVDAWDMKPVSVSKIASLINQIEKGRK